MTDPEKVLIVLIPTSLILLSIAMSFRSEEDNCKTLPAFSLALKLKPACLSALAVERLTEALLIPTESGENRKPASTNLIKLLIPILPLIKELSLELS